MGADKAKALCLPPSLSFCAVVIPLKQGAQLASRQCYSGSKPNCLPLCHFRTVGLVGYARLLSLCLRRKWSRHTPLPPYKKRTDLTALGSNSSLQGAVWPRHPLVLHLYARHTRALHLWLLGLIHLAYHRETVLGGRCVCVCVCVCVCGIWLGGSSPFPILHLLLRRWLEEGGTILQAVQINEMNQTTNSLANTHTHTHTPAGLSSHFPIICRSAVVVASLCSHFTIILKRSPIAAIWM